MLATGIIQTVILKCADQNFKPYGMGLLYTQFYCSAKQALEKGLKLSRNNPPSTAAINALTYTFSVCLLLNKRKITTYILLFVKIGHRVFNSTLFPNASSADPDRRPNEKKHIPGLP